MHDNVGFGQERWDENAWARGQSSQVALLFSVMKAMCCYVPCMHGQDLRNRFVEGKYTHHEYLLHLRRPVPFTHACLRALDNPARMHVTILRVYSLLQDLVNRYRDLVAIQTMAIVNAGLCEYHTKNCPETKQLRTACDKVRGTNGIVGSCA
jgi:hypothetical protein